MSADALAVWFGLIITIVLAGLKFGQLENRIKDLEDQIKTPLDNDA